MAIVLEDVTVIPASFVSVKPPALKVTEAAVMPVTLLYVPMFKTLLVVKVRLPVPILAANDEIELLELFKL